ncbi:MAG: hypothetical protein ACK56I_05250, partial [bacterium]
DQRHFGRRCGGHQRQLHMQRSQQQLHCSRVAAGSRLELRGQFHQIIGVGRVEVGGGERQHGRTELF